MLSQEGPGTLMQRTLHKSLVATYKTGRRLYANMEKTHLSMAR